MSGGKSREYWDAGLFIAWFTNETLSPPDAAGLEALVDAFDEGRSLINTSVITVTEFLQTIAQPEAWTRLRELFSRPDCIPEPVTLDIAIRAQEIRSYYHVQSHKDNLPNVTTPDALHLATAIERRCEVFYTFDGQNKAGKQRALIPMHEYIYGRYHLAIKRPGAGSSRDNLRRSDSKPVP